MADGGPAHGHGDDEGMVRLKPQAHWLRSKYPSAAAVPHERLKEEFAIHRMGLAPKLRRCPATTNVIESPTAGVRLRTRRVNWRGGEMVLRWAAAAFLDTEKSFRRSIGYQELWALNAVLEENEKQQEARVA